MYVVTSVEEKRLFSEELELLNIKLALLLCPRDLNDPQVAYAWGFSFGEENEPPRYALAERS